jgi:hypothetical protein
VLRAASLGPSGRDAAGGTASDPACQQEHDQNNDDQANAAAWAVAPAAAVPPRWNDAEQRKDQYDEKDRSETHFHTP